MNLHRRDFLRIGPVALGAPGLAPRAGTMNPPRARACILLYMDGGPSHIDLWDLKPDAPANVRGPFAPIATSVPGVTVCEHLPRVARRLHWLTQVRSVRHNETVHDPAVYQMLTGRKHISSAGNLKVEADDFPQLATAFGRADRTRVVMPRVVALPETMKMEGRVLPGQDAGFLGRSFDPLRVEVTYEGAVLPPEFGPLDDMPPPRQSGRAALLHEFDRALSSLRGAAGPALFEDFQRQALDFLGAPGVRRAFDLEREAPEIRDRYGRNRHGQSVLLARRLVEAGTRFVTVYWGRQEQDWADGKGPRFANNPWDTHRNHFPLTKEQLLPPADQALAALLDDLRARGLFDETLVVWMGDFGRTPRISKFASRDHWPHANTILMAGAGVPQGAIVGRTDRIAAEVTDRPVSPADLTATIFALLGVDPRAPIRDRRGLVHPISEGEPIAELIG